MSSDSAGQGQWQLVLYCVCLSLEYVIVPVVWNTACIGVSFIGSICTFSDVLKVSV